MTETLRDARDRVPPGARTTLYSQQAGHLGLFAQRQRVKVGRLPVGVQVNPDLALRLVGDARVLLLVEARSCVDVGGVRGVGGGGEL